MEEYSRINNILKTKLMRRGLLFLVIACFAVVDIFAGEVKWTSGALSYTGVEDNKVAVDGVIVEKLTSGILSIPASVRFEDKIYTVVGIQNNAFQGVTEGVKEILCPETMEYIGDYAFEGCSSLISILLPPSLNRIGESSFSNTSMESIILPDGVEELGSRAFAGTPLKTITFGKNLSEILPFTFYGTNFTEIILPEQVIYVGENSFANCRNLKKVCFQNQPHILVKKNAFVHSPVEMLRITSLGFKFEEEIFDPDAVITVSSAAATPNINRNNQWQENCTATYPKEYSENYNHNTEIGFDWLTRNDVDVETPIPATIPNSLVNAGLGTIVYYPLQDDGNKEGEGLLTPGMRLSVPKGKKVMINLSYMPSPVIGLSNEEKNVNIGLQIFADGKDITNQLDGFSLIIDPATVKILKVTEDYTDVSEIGQESGYVKVFNTAGVCVGEGDSHQILSNLPSGIYILSAKGKTAKIKL